jgi:HTH-type transcriptional regulator/antitoxin MqsA
MNMKSNVQKPRYCLQCDDGAVLEHGMKDLTLAIHGVNYTVPGISGWHCPQCGECEFDPGEGERHSAELDRMMREHQAKEIRAIRKKLGLKQSEAGSLFGGGVSAFSEYERGKTQPHKSTLLLFRLLDAHPELMRELAPFS